MKNKIYRNHGAVGALLDEYEKAIEELKGVIKSISINQLIEIADNQTKDEDCKSIQTILSHVISSGYNYVVVVRKWLGEKIDYTEKELLFTIPDYIIGIDKMFDFNVKLFEDYPGIKLEEYNLDKKIKVRWGQQYDVEQLLEHAIVHILRHRRQIERFKFKLEN